LCGKFYCGVGFNVEFEVVTYSLFLTKTTIINVIFWALLQKTIMNLINMDGIFFKLETR